MERLRPKSEYEKKIFIIVSIFDTIGIYNRKRDAEKGGQK